MWPFKKKNGKEEEDGAVHFRIVRDGNGNFFLQECVTVCDPCGWNYQREWVTVRTHRSAADAVDDMCGLMKADLKEVVAYASSPSIHPATIEE